MRLEPQAQPVRPERRVLLAQRDQLVLKAFLERPAQLGLRVRKALPGLREQRVRRGYLD